MTVSSTRRVSSLRCPTIKNHSQYKYDRSFHEPFWYATPKYGNGIVNRNTATGTESTGRRIW